MKTFIFKCDHCGVEAKQTRNRTPSGWREVRGGTPPPVNEDIYDVCPGCFDKFFEAGAKVRAQQQGEKGE